MANINVIDKVVKDQSSAHLNRLLTKLNAYKSNKYYLEQLWITNYLSIFTHNKYILKDDGSIAQVVYSTDERKKVYLKVNKLFGIYKAAFAKLWNALPLIQSNPSGPDSEHDYGADLAESIIKKENYEWKRNGLYSRSLMWYLVAGNAFVKPKYNKDFGKVKSHTPEGKKIKEGKIELLSVSPFNLYFDPTAYSIDTASEVYETFLMHKDVYKKMYGDNDTTTPIQNSLRNRILLSGDYTNLDKQMNVENYVELNVCYKPQNITDDKGEHTLFTADKVLETKNYPFDEKIGIPFAQAKRIETGFAYGETPISYSVPVEREYALYRGQMAEHAEKTASPIIALPVGSRLKAEKIANRKVKVIYYSSKYGEPKYIQAPEFPQYFHVNMAKFEEDLSDLNSIHGPSMAKRPEGVRSGLQQAQLVDSDDSQHIPDASNFYKMFEVAGHKVLEMIEKYYKEKRYVQLFGRNNIKYFEYTGSQLKGNTTITIDVVAGLPLNRAQRQQALMQLAATGAIQKRLLLELLELGELDPIYKAELADKIRQQIELDEIINGKYRKYDEAIPTAYVNPEDNHLVHMRELILFCKSSRYMKLAPKIKEKIWWHIEAHRAKLIQTFTENPIVATMTLNLENANESDITAIQMEVQRSTAEKGGQNDPRANNSQGAEQLKAAPTDRSGNLTAMSSPGPQVEAIQPLKS